MWTVNRIFRALLDATYAVLGAIHPAVALTIISGVFGVIALVAVRYCSNQTAIGRVKDEIKAHILAIKLYKDELRVMFAAMPRILWATARLQAHMLPPMLVMLVPMILICSQMAARHEWRPLNPGERAVLTMKIAPGVDVAQLDPQLDLPSGVTLDHRVRAPEARQVSWYVRGANPGRYELGWRIGGERITKELVVGGTNQRISPLRHDGRFIDIVLYPCEVPLPKDSAVRAVTIAYPLMESWFYGSAWWIFWFLVLSIVIALIFKPLLKVKF